MSGPDPAALRVGIVGCGRMGGRRARALGGDQLVGCYDVDPSLTAELAAGFEGKACAELDELLELQPDVVIVAVPHHELADIACRALEAGLHVLVEKPVGIGVRDVDRVSAAAESAGRRVKVGFNHRFYPGIARALQEVSSGRFGDVMFARVRYGHGGRIGYEREWRLKRELSGGGELLDQGMHVLDLLHWLMGPLPVQSTLLRTQFWETGVEDNAAMILGEAGDRGGPWAMFHVSWTEWKNLFSLEIYCRTGKLRVDGLAGSYGSQVLTIYAMKPELGPPDVERIDYPSEDVSWAEEWRHTREAIRAADGRPLLGDLSSARYAWECVEHAYASAGYPLWEAAR